jgi:hypothetical protein
MPNKAFSWQKAALCLGYACLFLAAVRRSANAGDSPAKPRVVPDPPAPRPCDQQRGSIIARSVGLLFLTTVVFAIGVALSGAFAASADDGTPVEAGSLVTTTEATTTDSATGTEPVTTEENGTTPETPTDSTTTEAAPPPPPPNTTPAAPPPTTTVAGGSSSTPHHSGNQVRPHHTYAPRPPESGEGGAATIWLHRTLPDPTPPARRLDARFAALLRSTAADEGIHWWRVLAVLRAEGRTGRWPASARRLERLAGRIASHSLRIDAEERSLARYNRAVGLRALVVGLKAAEASLEQRIIRDPRVRLSPSGAGDVAAGRVDVRVLVVIRYLVVTFHQVTVSSLITGHRFFARPSVVSAHVDGLAVDISSLKGLPIAGNQGIGGVAERAIEALLRLPAEVQPQQIISLLGLGGSSFALADHDDHIHVGF